MLSYNSIVVSQMIVNRINVGFSDVNLVEDIEPAQNYQD